MEQDDLDVDMSQLEINEKKRRSSSAQSPLSSPELDDNSLHPRRSGRKKIRPLDPEKRRVMTKPKKLIDGKNISEVHNYYLDKRIKRLPPSLETIFEEPKDNTLMSSRKFKRSIHFAHNIGLGKDKLKVKKRVMKARKVCTIKRLNKKIAMDLLMQKLSSIDDNDNSEELSNKGMA